MWNAVDEQDSAPKRWMEPLQCARNQLLQIHRVPCGLAKLSQRLSGVIFTPEETTVDPLLYALAKRLK